MIRRAFWLVFGGIWLVVGAGMLVGGLLAYRQEQQFEAEGQVADGIVLTKSIDRATRSTGGSRRTSTTYYIAYRFTAPDGRTVEGRDAVGVGTWEALEERGPVRIRYLPAAPDTNRLDGEGGTVTAVVLVAIGGILVPVGGFVTLLGWRQLRSRRRLLATGMPVEATVTEVAESRVRINGRTQWVIRYRYRDHMGQTHEGRSGYLPLDEADQWHAGDTAEARFDPARPTESLWVGRPEAESPGSPGQP